MGTTELARSTTSRYQRELELKYDKSILEAPVHEVNKVFSKNALAFSLPSPKTWLLKLHWSQVGSVLPNVGTYRCFLSSRGARYFFNLPILTLLAFNSIIFFVTIISLLKSYKRNEIARQQQSRPSTLRRKVKKNPST